MGLSKSKTKTVQSNDPWGPAQPYILKGLQQSGKVFDSQQPELEAYAKMQRDTYGRLAPGAEQGITGAQGLVNSTLNGDYLNGNPYTDAMLAKIRADTTNSVNGQFEAAGRYGSGSHAGILAKAISDAESNLLYSNYANERANQVNAVGQAQSLMGGSQSLLNNAADLPWVGVGALNGNVRQASNGYGTSTTTQTATPNWGQMLLAGAANAAAAYAGNPSASDRDLKLNIERVGEMEDGLGLYDFDYRQDTPLDLPTGRQRGVMADEVAALRPHALGPVIHGYVHVHYDAMPDVQREIA